MSYVQIQWTCNNIEEARKISQELVKKKWVACANILPHVESIYYWNGKIAEDSEVKVFFKTRDEYFVKILDYIIQHGSYDVPEISKIPILEGNPEYIRWLEAHVAQEA